MTKTTEDWQLAEAMLKARPRCLICCGIGLPDRSFFDTAAVVTDSESYPPDTVRAYGPGNGKESLQADLADRSWRYHRLLRLIE